MSVIEGFHCISNYIHKIACTSHHIIRQGYVNELVKPSWSEDGRVDDVRTVGGTDDEHVLLTAHAIHLCQDLVDHTICCPTWERRGKRREREGRRGGEGKRKGMREGERGEGREREGREEKGGGEGEGRNEQG